jgi:hypothetical protein
MADLRVRGAASPEQLAALLAVLHCRANQRAPATGYELWAVRRLRALRVTADPLRDMQSAR